MKTSARFTPELHERFRALLSTWPLRKAERDHLSSVEHERRWGRGHFAERRALLDLTLNRLARHGRTDMDAVFTALVSAKRELVRETWKRRQALTDRESRLKPWERDRVHLIRALEKYRKRRQTWDLAWNTEWRPVLEGIAPDDPVFLVERLIAQLNEEDPRTLGVKFPKGRHHPAAPARARKALAAAGVPAGLPGFRQLLATAKCPIQPPNLRDALLIAAGVLPVPKLRTQ
jgi:hypothetical protein